MSSPRSILAALLARLALPVFNRMAGRPMSAGVFLSPFAFAALAAMTFLVTLAAGAYPAFFLASLPAARVLKDRAASRGGRARLRQVLVIAQFCVSVGLDRRDARHPRPASLRPEHAARFRQGAGGRRPAGRGPGRADRGLPGPPAVPPPDRGGRVRAEFPRPDVRLDGLRDRTAGQLSPDIADLRHRRRVLCGHPPAEHRQRAQLPAGVGPGRGGLS